MKKYETVTPIRESGKSTMSHYSPLGATYGVRINQFLETPEDFDKYHAKLNRKLQKLRHHCRLTTKDTKKYSSKEKYSKIGHEEYDTKSKLFGTIVLLHAERDLALVETLKLKARQRGSLKSSERKVTATRLKKAHTTSQRLLEITQNESNWATRLEYLVYDKLCQVEYLVFGKQVKRKNSSVIAKDLALAFAALQHLQQLEKLDKDVSEAITSKFEYLLRQHADAALFTTKELQVFIKGQVQANTIDPLVKVLIDNGFDSQNNDIEMESEATAARQVQWRSFTAKIKDSKVAEVISEASKIQPKELSDYSTQLAKWQEALNAQRSFIEKSQEDEQDEDHGEDDQILLTYIQYSSYFTTVERDDQIFQQLWKQWTSAKGSIVGKLTKYKEIERIVSNIVTYLGQIMELPGVYSDDELLSTLKIAVAYYQLHLTAGCLASLYQAKNKYLESLALYVDAHKRLDSCLQESGIEASLPGNIITPEKIKTLGDMIIAGSNSVIALAEFEKVTSCNSSKKYFPTLLELLGKPVGPQDVDIKNLFPMRPRIMPVSAKPNLFDLAFNYITYVDQPQGTPQPVEHLSEEPAQSQTEIPKKKGIFGLFGR